MTVKELIIQLQQIENQDTRVVIRGTDPTDFTYYNDIEETRTSILNNDDGDIYEINEDDLNDDDFGFTLMEQVVILDGGIF
jgi:two-component sensor histidine kinase